MSSWKFCALLLAGGVLALTAGPSEGQNAASALPKVVLVGDSIRLGYAPVVAERLKGKVTIVSPEPNGGDSANVLKNLEAWVIREKPQLVHLNCGLHDLKLLQATKKHQVEPDSYRANLREIVGRIRGAGIPGLVFANTTPILDDRHAKRGANFDRFEADVVQYNRTAQEVMDELGVPVHDLHGLVHHAGAGKLLLKDGTHYTPEGSRLLGEAVADCILRQLAINKPRALSTPRSGAEAAAAYREQEARRDAVVPEAYRNVKVGQFVPPASNKEWKSRRADVYRKVVDSLGDLPPRPSPQKIRLVSREIRQGYTVDRVAIDNGVDNEVSALLLVPQGLKKPAPAVMWLHSSTPDKNQILQPNTFWGEEPLGETLVKAGYVVLSPDAYWHGNRAGTGPSGSLETLREEQESLFKFHLWMGRTLWGMFVRDDQIALDYLCSRPEVDKTRIGVTGMSMGSTRAWWLAAVDERVKVPVAIACMTRYQNLIRHGQLRAHGIYYFTNGLLKHFDTEGVLSLIAPRPFLILTGELDHGSPADGIRDLEKPVSRTYTALGAADRFRNVLYPEVGHTVTPAMRAEMLAWFEKWLK